MPRRRSPSPQTTKVLLAMADQPATWRYGYDLGTEVGLKSGSLYPILMRLADRALLDSAWEETPPLGRPARHLYRLTTKGLALAASVRPAAGPRPGAGRNWAPPRDRRVGGPIVIGAVVWVLVRAVRAMRRVPRGSDSRRAPSRRKTT